MGGSPFWHADDDGDGVATHAEVLNVLAAEMGPETMFAFSIALGLGSLIRTRLHLKGGRFP